MEFKTLETNVHTRLDRLKWGRFHWLVVAALGITWILDGLEVTLTSAVSAALQASPSLRMSDGEVGAAASFYLAGAVLGAIFFGWLTDAAGRKRLFFVTLGLYLLATAATALSQNVMQFMIFRFLTGAGIGGEYVAINSAIQEFIPAKYRGRTDLAINGSFWIGAAAGSLGATILLAPGRLPEDWGWRSAFGIGAAMGVVILLFRKWLPESPRWLVLKGREAEASAIVSQIEERSRAHTRDKAATIVLHIRKKSTHVKDLINTLLVSYPRRAILGFALMAAQAFFYNAIFFTFALVMHRFYSVPSQELGFYLLPFSISNFLGPVALGWLFDYWGRKQMMTLTYTASGLLLIATAYFFSTGQLSVYALTIALAVTFFFASPAASAAYLTVSESFPLEIRALAIAIFYALGTLIGGVPAPWLFGRLVETGSADSVALGYLFGGVLMILAGILTNWLGVRAERRSLEDVAQPLSARTPG